jgi:hypothetical protein
MITEFRDMALVVVFPHDLLGLIPVAHRGGNCGHTAAEQEKDPSIRKNCRNRNR